MKRKMLALILTLAMVLGLTACGGGGDTQNDAGEVQPDAVQAEEPEALAANYTVVESQPYSEGMAWVVYRDEDGTTYTGAMDKEGRVLFCIQGEAVETTPFKDGQAYIETEDGLLLVDQDGLVYDFGSNLTEGSLRAYGGGYAVISRTVSDILEGDTTSYVLVDSTGAERILNRKIASSGYVSSGIFEDYGEYYSPYADLWLDEATETAGLMFFSFESARSGDCAMRFNAVYDGYLADESNSTVRLIYFSKGDTKAAVADGSGIPGLFNMSFGEFTTTYYTEESSGMVPFDVSTHVNGQEFSGVYFLDPENGTFHTYSGDYAELLSGACFAAGEGKVALELNGHDRVTYLLITDRELKELAEPIPVGERGADYFVDSYGIVTESGIYDLEGNQISDGAFTNLEEAVTPEGGEIKVGDGTIKTGEGVYCDYTGQQLFESIDASGAQQLA